MKFFLIFTDHPPPKVYVLYTCENVDIFGWPLIIVIPELVARGRRARGDANS